RGALLDVLAGCEMARPHRPQVRWVFEAESWFRQNRLRIRKRSPVESAVITRKQHFAPRSEKEAKLAPACPSVVAAKGVIRMIEVAHEARARVTHERDVPHHFVLPQRPIDNSFRSDLAVTADNEMSPCFECISRLSGHDVDRAADRVAPVERTLRTSQNF